MLRLLNTSSGKVEAFKPANKDFAAVFSCGPSVYQRAHIGNFRTFLFEDILVRYLEYSGHKVKWGMTITDVEDKAIAEASIKRTTLERLTSKNLRLFIEDMRLLRMRLPDFLPKATESVDAAVQIIEQLLDRGIAYWHGGNVYFDPLRSPGFGSLYHLDMSRWPQRKRRFHKDTYPGMQWNLGDFILWHGYRKGDSISWDTRIGRGRPSWNVQDPAMITRFFTETLSMYCGGQDNLYRHHDYTKAILESVRSYPASRFWVHCRHLLVKGQKMSKSKGNICYTDTILDRGWNAAEARFLLIYGYYRETLDFSWDAMESAAAMLRDFKKRVNAITRRARMRKGDRTFECKGASLELEQIFNRGMDNDLNVRAAFDGIVHLLSQKWMANPGPSEAAAIAACLHRIDSVLNVIF
jgi:cysteinyl-tRNA synthetase